jgi:KUP system potassium uptake protein
MLRASRWSGFPNSGAAKSFRRRSFLGRQTLVRARRPGMALWREKLFAWMVQNSESAMEFFKLPTNQLIELGSQVEI